jgi:hypothetical protein
MGQCRFKTSEIKRCISHAINSSSFSVGYEFPDSPKIKSPGFLLVHDQGVYMMSNGQPRDLVGNDDAVEAGNSYVAYAAHCNPHVVENFWENSREFVGGDDFVEFLPFGNDPERMLSNCDQFEEYIVDVSPDYIECSFARPKAASSAPTLVAEPT